MSKTLTQKAAHQAYQEILSALERMIDVFQGARNEAHEDRFSDALESRHKQVVDDISNGLEWLDALRNEP
jgi:hypothetical protein